MFFVDWFVRMAREGCNIWDKVVGGRGRSRYHGFLTPYSAEEMGALSVRATVLNDTHIQGCSSLICTNS